jgi:hypothetical protein
LHSPSSAPVAPVPRVHCARRGCRAAERRQLDPTPQTPHSQTDRTARVPQTSPIRSCRVRSYCSCSIVPTRGRQRRNLDQPAPRAYAAVRGHRSSSCLPRAFFSNFAVLAIASVLRCTARKQYSTATTFQNDARIWTVRLRAVFRPLRSLICRVPQGTQRREGSRAYWFLVTRLPGSTRLKPHSVQTDLPSSL